MSLTPALPSRLLAWLMLLAGLALLPAGAAAELKKIGPAGSRPVFLRAEEAFRLEALRTPAGLALTFRVTPGYYLYRDRFRFTPAAGGPLPGTPAFARAGEWKDDPTFGRVQVYHQDIEVALPLTGTGPLQVRWQGCADAGLCYPPQEQWLAVSAQEVTVLAAPPAPAAAAPASTGRLPQLFAMLGLGLALAFTPCVLPMLPILAGLVARQHTRSARRGFLLALAYVLGVATVYALLGALVALFGRQINLPAWFQHPAILVLFAGLFAALALSLFGLFELRLPAALHDRLHALGQRSRGGALGGSYVMGLCSALVVSPCVSAPLVGVLLHIGSTGDVLFGMSALFLLALGMGMPLLVLGASEGRLLPRAGAWTEEVKTLLGLLLLFVAAELLARLLPPAAALALYAVCTAALGLWAWRLARLARGLGLLVRALGFCGLVYAAALTVGAAAGGDDPLRPLATLGTAASPRPPPFTRIHSAAELERELALARRRGQALLLDFYADWCVSCKVMERRVFRRPEVAARLARLHLVQADVTANTAAERALLQRFDLPGPPGLVFFNADGQELVSARLVGEHSAQAFLAHLDAHGL